LLEQLIVAKKMEARRSLNSSLISILNRRYGNIIGMITFFRIL
jgi:hypothetical protein